HLNPENQFWAHGAQSGSNLHRAWSGRPDRPDLLNCTEIREGELPAFGGHGNARGVAKIYAMLAGDGKIDGVRLLQPATVERASQLVWEDMCAMTDWPMRMGLGFEHNSPPFIAMGENMRAFGKLGSGGALGFCDRERNLAFSYCTNFQCEGAGTGIRCKLLSEAAAGVAPEWEVRAAE
ncbi:MAG: serine hydrolase, partial [Alphaproteobacteria bacterium]|nr:serine hydrolase [Alphaproteobacteria bacterium]